MYRQGDILLIRSNKKVQGKHKENGIILEGEVTGHAHKIIDGVVYEDEHGNIMVRAEEGTMLIHEEHDTINLDAGTYEIIRQRELNGYVED